MNFRDVPSENRFEQDFTAADGDPRPVFADYAVQGVRPGCRRSPGDVSARLRRKSSAARA
jgi:hypothetical protein